MEKGWEGRAPAVFEAGAPTLPCVLPGTECHGDTAARAARRCLYPECPVPG